MTEYLSPDEKLDLVRHIVSIVPDDLEGALAQLEDIAALAKDNPDAPKEARKEE